MNYIVGLLVLCQVWHIGKWAYTKYILIPKTIKAYEEAVMEYNKQLHQGMQQLNITSEELESFITGAVQSVKKTTLQ